MKRIALFLIVTFIVLTGCNTSNNLKDEDLSTDSTTVESDESTRQQMLFFSIYALDGLSSFALTQMIYEQPIIKKEVQIEYSIYQESQLMTEKILNDEASMALVPFNIGIDILKQSDKYKLIGVIKAGEYRIVGASNYEALKGKTIIVYDPTKSNGTYLTSVTILRSKLKAFGFNEGTDFAINYESDIERLSYRNTETVIMADTVVLDKIGQVDRTDYIRIYDEDDYALAMLINQSVVLIYPDVVSALIDKLNQSCQWLTENLEHAVTYAKQLDPAFLIAPSQKYAYFDAQSQWLSIKNLIEIFGYKEDTVNEVKKDLYFND